MMMSWHGNAFCITGPLWGESNSHRWNILQNTSIDWSMIILILYLLLTSCWTNSQVSSDLRCHDVYLISVKWLLCWNCCLWIAKLETCCQLTAISRESCWQHQPRHHDLSFTTNFAPEISTYEPPTVLRFHSFIFPTTDASTCTWTPLHCIPYIRCHYLCSRFIKGGGLMPSLLISTFAAFLILWNMN